MLSDGNSASSHHAPSHRGRFHPEVKGVRAVETREDSSWSRLNGDWIRSSQQWLKLVTEEEKESERNVIWSNLNGFFSEEGREEEELLFQILNNESNFYDKRCGRMSQSLRLISVEYVSLGFLVIKKLI